VFVAVTMVALLGIAALALDIGYLYVVRGELQNAADAGALAGAQVLYPSDGQSVNEGADDVARALVASNYSENATVAVDLVERGHWNPDTGSFSPNDSLLPFNLSGRTTADLNEDNGLVNAIRVRTTRKTVDGQVEQPFFAGILGMGGQTLTATAVAYRGFAGTLTPHEVDQPIAICRQAITDGSGTYSCNSGMSLSRGPSAVVAAWTNLSQPCVRPLSMVVSGLIYGDGNDGMLVLGHTMGTRTTAVQTYVLDTFRGRWQSVPGIDGNGDGVPDQLWKVTLPVVDCPASGCSAIDGAVEIAVVWVTPSDVSTMAGIPLSMFNPFTGSQWTCDPAVVGAQTCWDRFLSSFHLPGAPTPPNHATYPARTIYYLPDCTIHAPKGKTGGQNFGILARIPVLVQ
jgi:Flp pilus assembly protein TadG